MESKTQLNIGTVLNRKIVEEANLIPKKTTQCRKFQPKNRGGGKLNTQNTHIQYTHFPGLIETLQ